MNIHIHIILLIKSLDIYTTSHSSMMHLPFKIGVLCSCGHMVDSLYSAFAMCLLKKKKKQDSVEEPPMESVLCHQSANSLAAGAENDY